jgi:hypothetical protein
MSTKFIQKFDSITAPGAFLDRGSNVTTHLGAGADSGIGMDVSAGGILKYNKAGTVVTVADNTTPGQGTTSPAIISLAAGGAAGSANTLNEFLKLTTGIQDAAATAVITVTVPNSAQAGILILDILGSLGAGGAIGAFEASIAVRYKIAIARTVGVATVATASTIEESNAVAVAGAATVTGTGVVSAIAGAVGVTQTFTFNLTLGHSGGSSQNHQAVVRAQLINAVASGITLS